MGHSYWITFTTLVILIIRISCLPDRCLAGELDTAWATMSEACSGGYMRGRTHSLPVNLKAILALKDIVENGNSVQKDAAEKLLELVGEKLLAEAKAIGALDAMRNDEKKAQLEVVLEGLNDSKNSGSKVLGIFGGLAQSATRMAEANNAAAESRQKMLQGWNKNVFSKIRKAGASNLATSPITVHISNSGRSRTVWSELRNVSDNTLTNVTVIVSVKDGKDQLAPQMYFVKEWHKEVALNPDPFKMNRIPMGRPVAEPEENWTVLFDLWSDQGHIESASGKSVSFYDIRDPLLETMIREGAEYACMTKDEMVSLKITGAKKNTASQTLDVELLRTPLAQSSDPRKTKKQKFRGEWIPRPDPKDNNHSDRGLKLTLVELGASSTKQKAPTAQRNDSPRPIVFEWHAANKYTLKLARNVELILTPVEPSNP